MMKITYNGKNRITTDDIFGTFPYDNDKWDWNPNVYPTDNG